jgi:hypothetical protein
MTLSREKAKYLGYFMNFKMGMRVENCLSPDEWSNSMNMRKIANPSIQSFGAPRRKVIQSVPFQFKSNFDSD